VQLNRHLTAQVLSNVIHNAIKYSPRGTAVEVRLRLEDGAERRVCVDVRDRGRGIAEQEREDVFRLHVRGNGVVEPGSGVGLYYARELARMHGGDLVLVESQVNRGSTFRVTLPYR
jgi:signal transduction histidine kinase